MQKYLNSIIFLILLIFLLTIQNFFSPKTLFVVYTSFLILYLMFEIRLSKRRDRSDYLLNPAVLASLFTFILGFGITNYFLLDETSFYNYTLFIRFGQNPFKYLSEAMPLVIIGAIAMWTGYHSGIGRYLFKFLTKSIFNLNKYLRISFEIRFGLIIFFYIISILARVTAMYLGIFGYAQDVESMAENISISLFFNMLGDLGKFCLLIISLLYFNTQENKIYKRTFIFILLLELLFGTMSGMKSEMMMPFMIILLSNYFMTRKFNKQYILYFLVVTIIAFTIIEPFRILKKYDPNFKSTPGNIINTFSEAYTLSQKIDLKETAFSENVFLKALMRNNYTIEIARAKEYDDKVGLKEGDPDFKYLLFAVPLLAYIPRVIWAEKPIQDIALWFTQQVWRQNTNSSTAMTPFGFLYFAGGIPFIIFFLFIIGAMQETLFKFIKIGSGGLIMYIGLLSTMVLIDSNVSGIFISWLRLFPILAILQFIIFKQ